jgi:uncharacterized protein
MPAPAPPPSRSHADRRLRRRLDALPRRQLEAGLTVATAVTRRSRARGLAGLRGLGGDRALLLPRCRSVHTFGMRFALDLVWLDDAGAVVRIDREVVPRRLRTCWQARCVVEVTAGRADAFVAAGVGGQPEGHAPACDGAALAARGRA